jgi:hypothetical protein
MTKGKLQSRIAKAKPRTTSKGGQYITPFDLVRSDRGRAIVDSHASMSENGRATKSPEGESPVKTKRTRELEPAE